MRGFWGPRAEESLELARRVCALLARIEDLRPEGFGDWVLAEETRLSSGDPGRLAEYIDSEIERRGEDGTHLGVVLVTSAVAPSGAKVSVTATVGVTSRSASLKNSVVVEVGGPDESVEIAQRTLAALVDEWDPDWGDIASHQLWDDVRGRVRTRRRAPRIGYVTYLSRTRWGLVSAGPDLPCRLEQWSEDSGVLSLLSQTGSLPLPDAVVALDHAIDGTGAFQAMPTDRPHT